MNHQYRIVVDRVEHTITTTRKLRLEDGLVMEGEFPVRKFSTRKWSGSEQEMAAFIWSHHFDALVFRILVNRGKLQAVYYCTGRQQKSGIPFASDRHPIICSPFKSGKNITTSEYSRT
jgi:hypothetical protein